MSEFTAGVFLVDKPEGPSSFAMVRRVRKLVGIKKVGHAGTLDPFASGLLIICAGRQATKMISSFMDGEKEYLATLCLGMRTETLDPEGEVIARNPVGLCTAAKIDECLAQFRGEILQSPPAYSALKYKGKPLYFYARKGIEVKKEPRKIEILALERTDGSADLHGEFPELKIRVVCSKGTYIRTLADDIGSMLGCGAYLKELRRTRSGLFTVDEAVDGDLITVSEERENVLKSMMTVEKVGKLLQYS